MLSYHDFLQEMCGRRVALHGPVGIRRQELTPAGLAEEPHGGRNHHERPGR